MRRKAMEARRTRVVVECSRETDSVGVKGTYCLTQVSPSKESSEIKFFIAPRTRRRKSPKDMAKLVVVVASVEEKDSQIELTSLVS